MEWKEIPFAGLLVAEYDVCFGGGFGVDMIRLARLAGYICNAKASEQK